jgi:hypothetical protein
MSLMLMSFARRGVRQGPPANSLTGAGFTLYQNFDTLPLGTPGAGDRSYVTNEVSFTGTQSWRMQIAENSEGFPGWGRFIDFPASSETVKGQTIRARWWQRVPAFPLFKTTQRNGDRLKWARFDFSKLDGTYSGGYLDFHYNTAADQTAGVAYTASRESGNWPGSYWRGWGNGSPIPRDEWVCYELMVVCDDVPVSLGGTAEIRGWINGVPSLHLTDGQTMLNANEKVTRMLFHTYWNGLADGDYHSWLDETIVTTRTPTLLDSNGVPFLGTQVFDPTV